jgi:putative nucleotidyltransferase with HDIG domain
MAPELERVTRILAQVEDIPTLPTTVTEVLRIVDDPDCSATRLASLVATDPPLVARVLRLANSAYYGFPRAISAVPQAITLLGFATLRNVALSAAVFDLFRPGKGPSLDLPAIWEHSIGVAAASKLIARRVRFTPLEKAFTAGLLHDIGKVLIARYLHSSVECIVGLIETEGITIGEAEQQVLGVSHPAFGAWLAARWAFPPSLVDAIAFHHRPILAEENLSLAAIVCVADVITRQTGLGSGGDDVPREIDPVVLQALGLGEADLDELCEALAARQDDVRAFAATLGQN